MRIILVTLVFLAMAAEAPADPGLPWVSPARYRTLLTVDPKGVPRSNSPVSVELDFVHLLRTAGGTGTFDPDTIEVVAYDAAGMPVVFDATRQESERCLLPWRIEAAYPVDTVTFSFVLPNGQCTRLAVYYDTLQSKLGKPQRYPGLVGNGDRFTEGYKRREVNACGYDTWCDLDRDGDLDLFKGGTEPYIQCFENTGQNRFVDRGRLTSAGRVLTLPMDGNVRTWASIEFFDWDSDGDADLFMHSPTGTNEFDTNCLWRYENRTTSGGLLTFDAPQRLLTVSGRLITSGVTFVDWDGDGRTDLLGSSNGMINWYRNVGDSTRVSEMQVADPVYIRANGVEIQVMNPRAECADIDADGDLDLFVGTEEGRIYFFENVGTRQAPVFTVGRVIVWYEYMDARARAGVADFDGDGLLDLVPGRYWERTQWGEQPRLYGRMYKNVGTRSMPRFEPRDASNGAPYTQQFQIADAVRQNGVRVADWNNDGRPDLIAGDTDGFVWFFRNTTGRLSPVFAAGEKILAAGRPLRVYGEEDANRAAGYARVEVCDWNKDGRKDLLVADGRGWLMVYRNQGTDASPVLDGGARITANGKPIDGTPRGSVLVCDWNGDGNLDVIFGMVGQSVAGTSLYYDWPIQNAAAPWKDAGFLYYRNTSGGSEPLLARPEWITAGGVIVNYPSRPNLGSFVDWDGDGVKDFIAAEFEHAVHFYKNLEKRTGYPPILAAGVRILRADVFQTISGADAVDFNGDGDMDIVTGQGHGGSGLRFYERDYINDHVNETVHHINTWPTVTIGATERHNVQADFDADGDVDVSDFGHLQECLSEHAIPYVAGCEDADLDHDGDVDQYDFSRFYACLAGPDLPPRCLS